MYKKLDFWARLTQNEYIYLITLSKKQKKNFSLFFGINEYSIWEDPII